MARRKRDLSGLTSYELLVAVLSGEVPLEDAQEVLDELEDDELEDDELEDDELEDDELED